MSISSSLNAMTRHERLLKVLENARTVAVVTHDNPDPDAIAAGWGLVFLVERLLKRPARVIAGGAITRAENRAMVDLLRPPLALMERFRPEEGQEVVIVDTQLPARLERWPRHVPVAAVIDHHAHEEVSNGTARDRLKARVRDVRPSVVASSSIVAGYLRSLELGPDSALATALLYGIHTDAQGWDVRFSRTDRTAIAWLSQLSDPGLRAQIERAPIPRAYFEDLLLALQNVFVYGNSAICFLPSSESVEVVGEVADILIRCEGIHRVLCGAVHEGRMLFSARTSDQGGSAAELLVKTLKSFGSSGGHRHRAGGYIILDAVGASQQELESKLRSRWLGACNIDQQRGTRLVAKREILKALD